MTDGGHSACEQCGAPGDAESGCRACFEGLLAYEAERPAVFFAVHHLTVATYSLQHPAGYTRVALDAWCSLIDDVLGGHTNILELRRKNGRDFTGPIRVSSVSDEVPADWPHHWSMTACDVFDPRATHPAPDDYVERARKWAAATRADLSGR